MQVIEFLKANGGDFSKLTVAFGIKVKEYTQEGGTSLHVLNYDQINSPKTDPVVQECRGLILDNNLKVVCRPFDRFFNLGEAGTEKYDFTGYTFHNKLDGSLIKVYHWSGMWRIATRGTAFAESSVGDWGVTFEQLALKAAGCTTLAEFDNKLKSELQFNTGMTYLFELTALENRVVTCYAEPSMTLLAVRDNNTGKYFPTEYVGSFDVFKHNNYEAGIPVEDVVKKANALKNLEEGFVGYDSQGVPRIKIKSAAYVAVHHIRGEGLNDRRCCELVLSGEQEEYLTYFPEDRGVVKPYAESLGKMLAGLEESMLLCGGIVDQKEFALAIRDIPGKSVLFSARKFKISVKEAFKSATLTSQVDMLKNFMKGS